MARAGVVLGLDQGTTGTLALALTSDGVVIAQAYGVHRQFFPGAGLVEHDPGEILLVCKNLLDQTVAQLEPGTPLLGLGLANQGETVMAWQRSTARPIHNAIVWQDTRGSELMRTLNATAGIGEMVTARTGLKLDPYFSAGKIAWLRDHVPDFARLAACNDLCVGTLDAWLIWQLTGRRRFVTDASTAARTLLADIHHDGFDKELCALFNIPFAVLPSVEDSLGSLGTVDCPGHAWNGTRILASVVDQPAAMAGHGCFAPGSTKATFGSGCFVYMNTGQTPRKSSAGLLTTVAWRKRGSTTYALDGGVFAAGSVVTWLKNLGLVADPAAIDALLAGRDARSLTVSCVPALAGLAAPYWSRDTRAAWLGMDLGTERVDLVHAALLGVAARVAQVVHAMGQDAGQPLTELNADGGLVRCATLMQLVSDLIQAPVAVLAGEEATGIGAAVLASISAGLLDEETAAARVHIARRYRPQITAPERDRLMTRFERAVTLVKDWHA